MKFQTLTDSVLHIYQAVLYRLSKDLYL